MKELAWLSNAPIEGLADGSTASVAHMKRAVIAPSDGKVASAEWGAPCKCNVPRMRQCPSRNATLRVINMLPTRAAWCPGQGCVSVFRSEETIRAASFPSIRFHVLAAHWARLPTAPQSSAQPFVRRYHTFMYILWSVQAGCLSSTNCAATNLS